MSIAEQVRDYLVKLHEEAHANSKWEFLSNEKDGVTVYYYKKPEDRTGFYKVNAKFNTNDSSRYWNIVNDDDAERRKTWDDATSDYKILETIGEGVRILHLQTYPAAGGLISPRDIVELTTKAVLSSGAECYVARSIELCPKEFNIKPVPIRQGCVRAILHLSSLQTKKVEDGLEFSMLANTDINGYVPSSIVQAAMKGALLRQVYAWKKLVEQPN